MPDQPPQFHAHPGATLGRYELRSLLGSGGFAEVWLARLSGYAGFEKLVAIKLLLPSRQSDRALRTMLVDEANIAVKLSHPNIATIHELGEQHGVLFVVMEYLSGGVLDALLDEVQRLGETISLSVIGRILTDVAEGLHAAHELAIEGRPQGLIHRDVSPQNVLFGEGGQSKLIDFGIAKARERSAKETTTGVTKGKVAYMAPEHARGEALDRRADIWSLGAVAYELLEGRSVVAELHPIAQLRVLATEYMGPQFRATPPFLVPLLERTLARMPDRRPASALEFSRELAQAFAGAQLALASHAEVLAYREDVRRRAPTVEPPSAQDSRPRRAHESSAAAATVSELEAAQSAAPPRAAPPRAAFAARALAATAFAIAVGGGLALAVRGERTPAAPPPSPSPATRTDSSTSALEPTTAAPAPVVPQAAAPAALQGDASAASASHDASANAGGHEPSDPRAASLRPRAQERASTAAPVRASKPAGRIAATPRPAGPSAASPSGRPEPEKIDDTID
jgi:eukaryotic-like serine/threonine-protein kinase